MEAAAQSGGGAHGDVELVAGVAGAKAAVEVAGDGRAGGGVPGGVQKYQ